MHYWIFFFFFFEKLVDFVLISDTKIFKPPLPHLLLGKKSNQILATDHIKTMCRILVTLIQ